MFKFLDNMKSSLLEEPEQVRTEGNFFEMLNTPDIEIVFDNNLLSEKVKKHVEEKVVTDDIHEYYVSYNSIELQKIIQESDVYKSSEYSYEQLDIQFTGKALLIESTPVKQVEYNVPIVQYINEQELELACPIRVEATKNGSLNFNLDIKEMLKVIDNKINKDISKYIQHVTTEWNCDNSIVQAIDLVKYYKRDLIYTYPTDFNIADVTIEIDATLEYKDGQLISTPDYEMQVPNDNFKIQDIVIPTVNLEEPIKVELSLNRDNFDAKTVALLTDLQDFTDNLSDEEIDKYLFFKCRQD